MYCLEVVEFVNKKEEYKILKTKYKHIGYMNIIFETKKDVINYYDKYNPHMRSLNAHGTYCSDWDPNTNLLYIVRKDYGIYKNIKCFEE